jgi:hypothetical protein
LLVDISYFSEATRDRPGDSSETCAAWLNPRVRELDPDDGLMELHNELLVAGYLEDFDLDQPYHSGSLFHAWRGLSQDGKTELSCEAEGYAMFAADIDAFYADLFRKNNLHQAGYAE